MLPPPRKPTLPAALAEQLLPAPGAAAPVAVVTVQAPVGTVVTIVVGSSAAEVSESPPAAA